MYFHKDIALNYNEIVDTRKYPKRMSLQNLLSE